MICHFAANWRAVATLEVKLKTAPSLLMMASSCLTEDLVFLQKPKFPRFCLFYRDNSFAIHIKIQTMVQDCASTFKARWAYSHRKTWRFVSLEICRVEPSWTTDSTTCGKMLELAQHLTKIMLAKHALKSVKSQPHASSARSFFYFGVRLAITPSRMTASSIGKKLWYAGTGWLMESRVFEFWWECVRKPQIKSEGSKDITLTTFAAS